MRKIYVLLSLVGMLGIGFFAWNYFKTTADTGPKKEINTIVAYGDSLIKGVGATEGNDFISLVSEKIGKPIINEGTPGETSAQGLARIETIVAHKPDMAIVLFGGNDVLQRVDDATTFSNIRAIIFQLEEKDIEVVLLGVQGGAIGDPYKKEFEKLAKEFKLVYVSNVLDDLFADRRYMSDSVHPNDAGYAIIADRVAKALQPLISKE